ncbi:hypothetical protein D3C72_1558080 [compost metagenome]
MPSAIAQIEPARVFQTLVEAVEAWDGVADQVANTRVVADQPVPVHRFGAQCGSGNTGDDGRL